MSSENPNDDLRETQLDENDPVWRLLAQSPRPEPDGWFTARTLARCRHEGLEAEPSTGISLRSVWRWALGGGLSVCLAMLFVSGTVHPVSTTPDKQNVQEAFEIVASLNTDSDSSSSSSWTDSSL